MAVRPVRATKDNNFSYELNSNETSLALLKDGKSFIINARNKPGRRATRRYFNFPEGPMDEEVLHPDLTDPGCCAGCIGVNIDSLPYALLYIGCDSENVRENVTVKCSFDEGKTYRRSLPLSGKDMGGYCDIAVSSKGKVFAIWEDHGGANDHLTSFSFYDEFIKE